MNLNFLDWAIVFCSIGLLTYFSLKTVKYMKGVADFLSANRSAGRFLLSIAGGMSGVGAISAIAMFEMYYAAGFPPIWWSLMMLPVGVFIVMTGWVYYRFRETRCMTIAQFFEVRYSKKFRIYSGIITWLSGIVNFGIFPAVASRFFVYFCGFPNKFMLMGMEIPTFAPVMILTLGIAMLYTCLGGQITVMVTDCIQGIFCAIAFIIVCLVLLNQFSWLDITQAIKMAPVDASMLHPYHTSKVKDFNVFFFLITVFGSFYAYMSWQGSQAYFSSGLNPHEQKMGAVISLWKQLVQVLMLVLLPICAFAFLNLPKFSTQASAVVNVLKTVDNSTIANQMRVPVALAYILPNGIKGLFCAVMLFFLITTQDTYLHSWGSILIQDVILPFRKKPLEAKHHVSLLRWSIFGVAVFAFLFSLLFRQSEYILMFFAITGAIVSGLGAAIVGGLYWKRGTTFAACTALTIGWVMAISRIVLRQIAPHFKNIADRGLFLQFMDKLNSINSQTVWFFIMLSCILSYIIISILTCRKPFNMQRMLHIGEYAVKGEHVKASDAPKSIWWKIMGISKEFSRSDKFLAGALVVWNFGWFGIFLFGTIYNLIVDVPTDSWATFWHIWIWLQLLIGIPATIWFTWGGIRDIKRLFKRLSTIKRNDMDDGTVVHHHLLGEKD
ncbi:sodium:solute symporter [bacterium]|nr:sodium:solute symporter [bacterium]